MIDKRLPQWREASGAKDAKVILLAHSMGGLVSRYYTEVLKGWKDCRALITFGTPHRGSPNALNFLVNGYKKLIFNLTEPLRSFASVYQLLPRYKTVAVAGQYQYVAKAGDIPNIDRLRAEDAFLFHQEIEAAVREHRNSAEYLRDYKVIPVVGTHQKTRQSAGLTGTDLTLQWEVPSGVPDFLGDGDGTVPRISAIPIELSNDYRETYIAEKHGSLQNNQSVLKDLIERLKVMQTNLDMIRGSDPASEKPSLSLEVDDLYFQSEPIELHAEIFNSNYPGRLEAFIESVNVNREPKTFAFQKQDHQWMLMLNDLDPGLYRIEVRPSEIGAGDLQSVHDLFEVVQN